MRVMINACKIVVGKPQWKTALEKPTRRSEHSIKVYRLDRKMDWEGMDWIQVTQDRVQRWALANTAKNFKLHKRRAIS
jgi:hypothetical protein